MENPQMSNASMFQGDDAKFVVTRNSGRYVTAEAALTDPAVVGYGVFIPQWRDFTWEHIARVERNGDQINLVYVQLVDSPDNKREGNVTHEITVSKPVERTLTLDAADQIVVSNAEVARPKGRRHGKIITYVNEELPE